MYTPAEDIGLTTQRLADRIQRALARVATPAMVDLLRAMRRAAEARHMAYQRHGVAETVRLFPCPLVLHPDQLGYTHYVAQTLLTCLKRLPDLYFEAPEVREILRVTPVEEQWLRDCWTPAHREANPVFGRLDAVVDYATPEWKDTIRFLEPNLSGIGGLHMGPTATRIVADLVLPALLAEDPSIRLQLADDIRDLLLQELLEHLDASARHNGQIVLVDPKYAADGPDEPDALAAYYRAHHGMAVLHADVSELRLRGEDVFYGDERVDLVYRDMSVLDLMDLKAAGVDIAPMRTLFRANRVVSSIAAELDQKSCFEVLTTPELTERLLTVDERAVARRHVLWTRIVSERRTISPTGRRVDLLEYARQGRESLVLKPNRAYGGAGVLIGPTASQRDWEAAIGRALADPNRWVVQLAAPLPVKPFHTLDEAGRLSLDLFNVVMGLAPSRYGVALVARAAKERVVNVAQQGGMCAVMVSAKALPDDEGSPAGSSPEGGEPER